MLPPNTVDDAALRSTDNMTLSQIYMECGVCGATLFIALYIYIVTQRPDIESRQIVNKKVGSLKIVVNLAWYIIIICANTFNSTVLLDTIKKKQRMICQTII